METIKAAALSLIGIAAGIIYMGVMLSIMAAPIVIGIAIAKALGII